MEARRVVCVGELVWDCFPDRRVMGGAPVNVACGLVRRGVETVAVSRVGRDALGDESVAALAGRGLDTAAIQRDPDLPTGRVNVGFGKDNEPAYDIVQPAAWDAIDADTALAGVGEGPYVLVHGTLGLRAVTSRRAVTALRARAALIAYDVNLRPPHTTSGLVLSSLTGAGIVKVNDDELAQLARWCALEGDGEEAWAAALGRRYDLAAVVVTRGPHGALAWTGEGIVTTPGIAVEVVDTVGAGDAFFAALLAARLSGAGWPAALEAANAAGAETAAQPGASYNSNRDFCNRR